MKNHLVGDLARVIAFLTVSFAVCATPRPVPVITRVAPQLFTGAVDGGQYGPGMRIEWNCASDARNHHYRIQCKIMAGTTSRWQDLDLNRSLSQPSLDHHGTLVSAPYRRMLPSDTAFRYRVRVCPRRGKSSAWSQEREGRTPLPAFSLSGNVLSIRSGRLQAAFRAGAVVSLRNAESGEAFAQDPAPASALAFLPRGTGTAENGDLGAGHGGRLRRCDGAPRAIRSADYPIWAEGRTPGSEPNNHRPGGYRVESPARTP